MKRRNDGDARRQELCDAAIELLAQDGARGLTHLRVDRRVGVADGSTSFYFSTRAALLRAVTNRVVAQDIADFEAAMAAMKAAGDRAATLLSTLAEQAVRTAVEPDRSRARARFELMMMAQSDPELASVFDDLMDRFTAIGEEAVARLQPAGAPPDAALVKEQAFAMITFLGGFLFRLANGIAGSTSARQLEGYLRAVIAGVAAEHARDIH
ncbi:TetR/AcrR family transcriptional regulator [Nocardia sp. BMG111209]|uniref:TetR/AcrR family transcriptional regulator n=1 Tax=Nocardia sp. BMG111209 TaxID=1160137 RepID=UPI0003A96CAB|nr:TetR family transcriptional regulator [Nocardia sp. BMG111209]